MKRVLVIYGSTTGNSEFVARRISEILANSGVAVELKDVVNVQISDLFSDFELIILGCSTWGEEEIGFQEDFESFYFGLSEVDFTGKPFALFGCGDSGYKHFCGAVDELEDRLQQQGAEFVGAVLKIDGEPEEALEQIEQWSSEIAAGL